jgi:hypothetical protein
VNFEPDFDAPDRPGLISRQEAAELAGMKAPPRQVSEHNSGLTWTYSDDDDVVQDQAGALARATAYMNRAGVVTWPGLGQLPKATVTWTAADLSDVKVNWGKSTYGSQDKPMRFEWNPEPFNISQGNPPPPQDDTATRALKARQARNTGPKRPDAGHSKRKRKHRG